MKRLTACGAVLLAFVVMVSGAKAWDVVHHDLRISLFPEEHRFTARDTVTLSESLLPKVQFLLHRGLEPSSPMPGVRLAGEPVNEGPIPLQSFKVALPPGQNTLTIEYGGRIHHPLETLGKEYARGFKQSPGMISAEGVYLSGGSFWYPTFAGVLMTFGLEVDLPAGWDAVSQGERTVHSRRGLRRIVRWETTRPQEEIFLVAGVYTEYVQRAGRVQTMVFLRTPEGDLAEKYLDATARYLAMYEELIGPYPYRKFALVENFWETGFGMPSFALLGPRVIRFPFILYSSFPHEILHNWWGNGVFPDQRKGNWSEGLTAYLSDHLIQEQKGRAQEYRRETLQKYADYVVSQRDFSLAQFRSRRSPSSEAVGYGKSLMLFHMIRLQLGRDAFVRGLRDFYRRNRFRSASFDDLRESFERVSGRDLRTEFGQWVMRRGAPQIRVSGAKAERDGEGYVLSALLEQVQPGEAYDLRVPIAVTMAGHDRACQTAVTMRGKRFEMRVRVPSRPLRLDVDPEFDLFRRLDRKETPPALTQAFGSKRMLIVLPSSASESLLEAYRGLSQSLGALGPDQVETRLDRDLEELPSDRAVVLLGWENRFQSEIVAALTGYDVRMAQTVVRIGRTEVPRRNHTVVLSARLPGKEEASLTWIASDRPEAIGSLGRKLPHYHKYSYLVFEGREAVNRLKGRWPVVGSPMTVFIPLENGVVSKVEMGKLGDRKPLVSPPRALSREGMVEAIRFVSSHERGGGGFGRRPFRGCSIHGEKEE